MVIEVSCATLVCDFQVVFIFISHDLNALLRRNTNLKLNAFFFTWELVGRLWRSESESLGLCKILAFIRWNDEWGHGMNLKAFRIFGRSQSQNLRIMLRQCEQQNYSQQICGCLNIYTDTFIDFPQYLAVSISRLYFGARSFGCCCFFLKCSCCIVRSTFLMWHKTSKSESTRTAWARGVVSPGDVQSGNWIQEYQIFHT